MEEINPNQSIPPTYPASPVPPANSGQSFFKKPVGLVLLVIIVLAVLLIFGSLIAVQKPTDDNSLAARQERIEAIVARVKTTTRTNLSMDEKKDILNFIADPSAQQLDISEEDKMRIIEALNK